MPVTAPSQTPLFLDGPAGRLESVLEAPAQVSPVGGAVVCHPHPQHGGTMHNKVVHTLSRAFLRCGFETLRFNFRGTESSEGSYDDGRGELDDALVALAFMRDRLAGGRTADVSPPLWLAGFSFGAAIVIRAAATVPVGGLISVAPAVSRFTGKLERQPDCPWLIVHGDQDELADVDETVAWVNGLLPGPELLVMTGAEHFFHARLVELREHVSRFVAHTTAAKQPDA